MKIAIKLPLVTSATVFVSVVIITVFSIYNFKQNSIRSIERYRTEELTKVQQHIKDIVDLSYEMIATSYQNSRNAELIEQHYGVKIIDSSMSLPDLSERILNITLENLRVLRYGNNDEGYIWINNINLPYKVIMHPIRPELEGERLDKPEFNLVKGTRQNVYAAFADMGNKYGEGFLEYDFYKPGEDILKPKISYIKLFKPKNWIIGTGVYIDEIDQTVQKKREELEEEVNSIIFFTVIVGLLVVAFAFLMLLVLGNNLSRLINEIRLRMSAMAQGKEVEKMQVNRKDEIGQMKHSLDLLIDGMSRYTKFAKEIGKGNLDADFTALSKQDVLGNSLLDMRDSLKDAKIEEEKRRQENAKRNWTSEGIAKFGEIIRQNAGDIKELTYLIVSNIVKYMNAAQGGIFLVDDSAKELSLELIATYAFGRKKLNHKYVRKGEGLVGTVAVEMETLHMTEIPDDYIKVTSGLGQSNPQSLLIVPMKTEDKLMGIIELASFEKFEDYQIEFVERISQTIASSLSTAKLADRTTDLLQQSRIENVQMQYNEDLMRKSMEELEIIKSQNRMED